MIKGIKPLFLILSYIFSVTTIYASKEIMYEYLLQKYQEICQNDDDVKKIEELKVLLVEVEIYYQGLLVTPDPARHLAWMLLWGFAAQQCLNRSFLYYACCFALIYKGKQLLDDGCRYLQRDNIRERYARLESLIAGIKIRLDDYAKQTNS